MTTLLSKAEGQYQILYFFCMVTGMRVSEAVAVEIGKHIETDCSIVYVRQQREKSKNCVKAHLETESGCRDVDIHPDAAAVLRNFIGDRKDGFLFQTADGRMFDPRSIARANLEPIFEEMGRGEAGTMFNVFRFREAVLRNSFHVRFECPIVKTAGFPILTLLTTSSLPTELCEAMKLSRPATRIPLMIWICLQLLDLLRPLADTGNDPLTSVHRLRTHQSVETATTS